MKQVIYFCVFTVLKLEMVRVDTTRGNLDLLDLEKTWRYWRKPRPPGSGEDMETILDTH